MPERVLATVFGDDQAKGEVDREHSPHRPRNRLHPGLETRLKTRVENRPGPRDDERGSKQDEWDLGPALPPRHSRQCRPRLCRGRSGHVSQAQQTAAHHVHRFPKTRVQALRRSRHETSRSNQTRAPVPWSA